MRLFNVLTKKEFPNNGETTILWHKVGLVKVTKGGNWYLQMFHQPETDFFIFECKEKEEPLPEIQIEG